MIWNQDNVKTAYACFTHSSRRCCLTYIYLFPSKHLRDFQAFPSACSFLENLSGLENSTHSP